jgi:hypothetical protein
MADYDSRFNRLALSAADLKVVTALQKPGEPWPDALIEDYLNILRDLIELAELIDQNAAEIIRGILALEESASAQDARIAKAYGQLNVAARNLKKNSQLDFQYAGKQKSLTSTLRKQSNSFFPLKAFFCSLAGTGASTPTVNFGYNYLSILRSGVGTYQITLLNTTINGKDLTTGCVFTNDFRIVGNATSDLYQVEIAPGVGNFTVRVYQYTIVGVKLTKTLYDLQVADAVNIMILVSDGSFYQAL